jgi:RimJ/RimL family protein N-acetyltransferase
MTIINTENPILIDLPLPIETDRLIIREPRAGDGQALYEAKMETWELLSTWMPWARDKGTPQQDEIVCREAQIKFLQRTDLMMFAFDKETGALVGGTGLHRFDWHKRHIEIGYWVAQSMQGKGYATEMTKALICYAAKVCDANKIIISHGEGNAASRRVIEKSGFIFEYTAKNDYSKPDGSFIDHHYYRLWNADHLKDFNVTWGGQK